VKDFKVCPCGKSFTKATLLRYAVGKSVHWDAAKYCSASCRIRFATVRRRQARADKWKRFDKSL
jgi:hypothetical protein